MLQTVVPATKYIKKIKTKIFS